MRVSKRGREKGARVDEGKYEKAREGSEREREREREVQCM